MEKKIHNEQEIDITQIISKIWKDKQILCKFLIVGTIIGIIIAFSIPQRYTVKITLSPESGQTSGGNNLSGMAAMLGFNGIGNITTDAINSSMLPDIISSTPFLLEMYNLPVKSNNESIALSEYIKKEKKAWWSYIIKAPFKLIHFIKKIIVHKTNSKESIIDPYRLTEEQANLIDMIRLSLTATVDSKTNMAEVTTTFQDAEVAALVANFAVQKLQEYITKYRIQKAENDCNYIEKICKERKEEYYKAQKEYAKYIDGNKNIILQSTQVEATRLENEMNIAFQIYSQVETQLQIARAKVQEAKPVFVIIEPATVPIKPTFPNKSIIIIIFILLSLTIGSLWILYAKNVWKDIYKRNNVNKI